MAEDTFLARIRRLRRRLRFGFFWQLLAAFTLIILLVAGGMYLAGRVALTNPEIFPDEDCASVPCLWTERLTDYYARNGSWEGASALLAEYPCGPGWEVVSQDWEMDYILATADGTIVAAGDETRIGGELSLLGRGLGIPIVVDERPVGLLRMRILRSFGIEVIMRRFLMAGLVIAGLSLIVVFFLSRRISQPLVDLTAATRAVADGDLGARVDVRSHGEVRELAAAFNQMAEELAHADNLRRNMTADVAHELRTPLSVIRGKLEGVLDGVYAATPEHLEPILEETKLLAHLVEDLRLLALAEAGQLTLEKRPVDVGDLLRDAHVNFGPHAADQGVTLALDLPPELPQAMADWRRVTQVLGNLLSNALRHTPRGGCVTLSAGICPPLAGEAGGGWIEISVADTGTGIRPEDIPYVFERFWRGEKSRSRAGGGTGLGLAIVKQLVEMHGGSIGVESAPGAGSKFRFTLPTVADTG